MTSKFFKGLKKAQLPKPDLAPRVMEEIQKEHSQASYEAGLAQYQVYIHTKDLEQKNTKLLALNQEAAARNKLDAASKPQEVATNE